MSRGTRTLLFAVVVLAAGTVAAVLARRDRGRAHNERARADAAVEARIEAEIDEHLARLAGPGPAERDAAAEGLIAIGPRVLFKVCPFIREHLADESEDAWRAAYHVEEQIALRCQDDPRLDDYYRTLKPIPAETITAKLPGGLTMEFVKVPTGVNVQGSENPGTGVPAAADMPCNYAPVRKVAISRAFWMAREVVTQQQWASLMDVNRCRVKIPHHAIDTISWDEAVEFCRKLGELNRPLEFALPTEAQWEHACRAFTTGRHAFGNEQLFRGDMRMFDGGEWSENRLGLRQMHHTVFEWCSDYFGIPGPEAATDPTGPAGGDYRVVRSNYTYCSATECRAAHRVGFPDAPRNGIGFRPVAPVE